MRFAKLDGIYSLAPKATQHLDGSLTGIHTGFSAKGGGGGGGGETGGRVGWAIIVE